VNRFTPLETSTETILQLLLFGDLLLALYTDNTLRIWNHKSGEYYNTLSFSPEFTATMMVHPATYLNKVLVASQEGKMQLWNIRTM
jgi:U3 small nucleolar RNA-associated protein 21